MNFTLLEKELKKRHRQPYIWGRKQTDLFDKQTNFVYKSTSFNQVLDKITTHFKNNPQQKQLRNYALNRWYNFWSAKAVEAIFCEHPSVKPHQNSFNKFTDFYINNTPFDHKTSVFPKGFGKSLPYCIEHKKELIQWLYQNQSTEQRQHFKNRLFIVLYNFKHTEEHWKLKAELFWLKQLISGYLLTFTPSKLIPLKFNNKTVYSDIIWAIK